MQRKDVSIEMVGNELVVSGEFTEKEKVGWFRSRTRRVGRFEYRAVLPQDVDAERIAANLADGVLTVTAPKTARARRRRIEVTGR